MTERFWRIIAAIATRMRGRAVMRAALAADPESLDDAPRVSDERTKK